MPLGKRITIIGAELVGLELAEFLAERGREVTVIDSASKAGKGLYLVRRLRLLSELKHLGVTMIKQADDIAIGDHQITYRNYRNQQRSFNTDHVIVAQGATGDTVLADELRSAGFKTHTVGDCNGISYIEGAIESAAELAVALD
jgi:NADPH-dependent 2,4-dienoyl-CoA reductase/sulfur reductase-like enzyme